MDYTQQKPLFKIKKSLRYLRLYGPLRTLVKVRGQYHMKKVYNKSDFPALNKSKKGKYGFNKEHDIDPREKTFDDPGTEVIILDSKPPVHDSATEIL